MVLRISRMRFFGHAERSTCCIAEVFKLNVVAQKGHDRSMETRDKVLVNERKKLGMDTDDPHNR